MSETNENTNDQRLVGLLAQFEDPNSLVHACDEARQFGYKRMDAYSPFPVHGIDPAIGIRRTILPWICLAVGLGAVAIGLGLQFYTNGGVTPMGATDASPIFPGYQFKISGKPYFSLPANIPVTFEVIVLSTAFAAFLGMWALNGLPRLANPLHRISRFKRATNDKFFLMINTTDDKFDREKTESQLNEWGASYIEECNEDLTDQQLPKWLQLAGLMIALLMLVPPVLIFRAQGMTNKHPRLHVVPDMDWQHKLKTQKLSPNFAEGANPDYLFASGRGMLEPVPGTIARGRLFTDSEYYQGIQSGSGSHSVTMTGQKSVRTGLQQEQEPDGNAQATQEEKEPNWVKDFPEKVKVDEKLLSRGKKRFEIYCSVCHGYDGNGDGLVNQRAMALNAAGKAQWTTAKSLHDPEVKKNDVGRIFDTISNGRGTMGPYKDQIPVEDRWAIVAYVRALQKTGIEPPKANVASNQSDSETLVTKTNPDGSPSGKPQP